MKVFEENLSKEKFEKEQKKFNSKLLEKLTLRKFSNELDVNSEQPEKAFSSLEYYKAMKEVPLNQKKALYLLVVCEFSLLQVAKMLNKKPSDILSLSLLAIKNFKTNLRKGNEENGK